MSSYGQYLSEAIAFGAILGLAICYAVGHWWPKTEAERKMEE